MPRDYGLNEVSLDEKNLFGGHPPILQPVTIAFSGTEQTLEKGAVLGLITASGKYTGLDPDAADGSAVAKVVLAEDVTIAADADAKALAVFHGDVIKDALVWTHTGITEAEQTAAYGELQGAGIYARTR